MRPIPRIVIIGGGFGGVEVAKRLAPLARKGKAWVTILNANEHFLFTPLLHEVAGGSLSPRSVVEPLRQIFADGQVNVRETRAVSVDSERRVVRTEDGDVPYDYLVVSTGSTTNFFGVPGAQEHSMTLKSLDDAKRLRDRILDLYDQAAISREGNAAERTVSIAVVGGGPTGVELSAELADLCRRSLRRYYGKGIVASISIVASDPDLLARYGAPARAAAARALRAQGVDVRTSTKVVEVGRDYVELVPIVAAGEPERRERMHADVVVWVAGVTSALVPLGGAVELECDGRAKVDASLRSKTDRRVFVLGDAASGSPMLAQVAVAQGAVVARNVAACVAHDALENPSADVVLSEFRFSSKGQLASLGRFRATGDAYGIAVSGPIAWFMWRTVYLFKFHSWRKRFRIMFEWTIDLFSTRDITR